MTPYITRVLAQQIVNTVKDLCGQNVNFIDCSGTILPTPPNPASECSMKSDSRQQLCRGSRTGSGTDPGFCQFTQ